MGIQPQNRGHLEMNEGVSRWNSSLQCCKRAGNGGTRTVWSKRSSTAKKRATGDEWGWFTFKWGALRLQNSSQLWRRCTQLCRGQKGLSAVYVAVGHPRIKQWSNWPMIIFSSSPAAIFSRLTGVPAPLPPRAKDNHKTCSKNWKLRYLQHRNRRKVRMGWPIVIWVNLSIT